MIIVGEPGERWLAAGLAVQADGEVGVERGEGAGQQAVVQAVQAVRVEAAVTGPQHARPLLVHSLVRVLQHRVACDLSGVARDLQLVMA